MRPVGVDVGFGFTKATNGNEYVIFKSIIGEYTDIQFDFLLEDDQFEQNLQVKLGDNMFFLGELAEKQSLVKQYTLDQDKLVSEFVKILAISGVGMLTDEVETLNVVTGLPVGYYRRDAKKIQEILRGFHKIEFLSNKSKGREKRLNIAKVKVVPQPMGSVFNLLFDEKGKVTNKKLVSQKIGVVDIGFRTTDFVLLDHLRYVERGSTTTDNGMSKCFGIIANKLRQKAGVSIELYRLYEAIFSGSIKIKGKEYNIVNLKERVYSHFASQIATDINRVWENDWDIDLIVLTGGGAKELFNYIKPLVEGNIILVESKSDPRLNNVMGYLKYGIYDANKLRKESPVTEVKGQKEKDEKEEGEK